MRYGNDLIIGHNSDETAASSQTEARAVSMRNLMGEKKQPLGLSITDFQECVSPSDSVVERT